MADRALADSQEAFRRIVFGAMDTLRRSQAGALSALGLGPPASAYDVVASGPHWRLRDYGGARNALTLLIVAAPIKRPYIWDLAPSISAIRYCLEAGLHVLLLEWIPPTSRSANCGLDEHVAAIADSVAEASRRGNGEPPVLIGHSLGGTLAAIYAALRSSSIRGLCLLSAPLCFEPRHNRFRDGLITLLPAEISQAHPFPGSLLSTVSAMASPGTFIWSRMIDSALSVGDAQARAVHARVERWALDEVPLSGALVHQIVEWLYRENQFCRGTLRVGEVYAAPSGVTVPVLAVVNTSDDVAPLASVKPFLDQLPIGRTRIIEYPGEVGVCLQHLGLLVGRLAFSQVWPEIVSWVDANR